MNNNLGDFTPKQIDDFLNGMNIFFYLSVCIPLLFFILIFLDLQERGGISPSFENGDEIWQPVLAVATVLLSIPGYAFYKKETQSLEVKKPLPDKLQVFKRAALRKYFFISLGSCLANVCLYIFSEQVYLLAFAVLLVMFSVNRPTVYRIKKDLPLSKEERIALTAYRKYL